MSSTNNNNNLPPSETRPTYLLHNGQNIRRLYEWANKLDLLRMHAESLVGETLTSQLVDQHVRAEVVVAREVLGVVGEAVLPEDDMVDCCLLCARH